MPTLLQNATPYKRGTKVRATRDLRGVPEGTTGRITTIGGLTWLRYWVEFENGVGLGSVDHDSVVPVDQYEEWKRRKAEEEARAAEAAAAPPAAAAEEAKAAEGEAAAKSKVPAHLLERSKAARARKAAG